MPITCTHCNHVVNTGRGVLLDENHCPSCGAVYEHAVSTLALRLAAPTNGRIGKFELLCEIGAGTFGTVYKARDPELDRVVAIKVPRAGTLADGADIERFLREARSVAQIRHPRIVPIHEVGECDGVPYLVSEFVEGVTLADLLTARPLAPKEAARLIADLADGLQYAHEHGVIHRDVKPQNIILGTDLTPNLMDFGLAKREGGAESTVTLDGQVLGTPAYMSPEQARGDSNQVDGRSDVYSLGVVLYQLLAYELPFRGNLRMLLHQVQHSEPRSPRSLNDRIPVEIETICLKCLRKEPQERYSSAKELADDLRRFLCGESPVARPRTPRQHAWDWAKRRPAITASLALTSLVSLVAFVMVSVYAWMADSARGAEEVQRERAEDALAEADRNLYFHRANLAYRELQANNVVRAQELLEECPASLRNWEWNYVKRACNLEIATYYGSFQPPGCVAYSPDGKLLAAACSSPLQYNQGGDIRMWHLETGQPVPGFRGHRGGVFSVAFSPDGQRLLSAGEDGTLRSWEVASGSELLKISAHSGAANAAQFSPDGKFIASVGGNLRDPKARGQTILWDAFSGAKLSEFPGGGVLLRRLAFSADGAFLAACGGELLQDGEILIWRVPTAQLLRTVRMPNAGVNELAFHPGGNLLAAALQDSTVRLWDVHTGECLRTLSGHSAPVASVAYSPDGKQLASASGSLRRGEAKVWDADTGKLSHTLRGANGCVAFSPDGLEIATSSTVYAVKLWDAVTGHEATTLSGGAGPLLHLAYSPDGKYLAAAAFQSTAIVWNTDTGRELLRINSLEGIVRSVAFSPDGKRLATVSGEMVKPDEHAKSKINLWDVRTGEKLLTIACEGDPLRTVAFSPDGERIAGAISLLVESQRPGLAKVWSTCDGRELLTLRGHKTGVSTVIFSPDGQHVLTAGEDRSIRVWDAASGKELKRLLGHRSLVYSLAFHADGKLLASTGWDGSVKLWEMPAGELVQTLRDGIMSPTISRNGTRVASVTADQALRIWDIETGQEALTIREQPEPVRAATFSPDGTRLAFCAGDQVHILDGSPCKPPSILNNPPRFGAEITPDAPRPRPRTRASHRLNSPAVSQLGGGGWVS